MGLPAERLRRLRRLGCGPALAVALCASCAGGKAAEASAAVDALNRVAFLPPDAFLAGPEESPREVRLDRAVVIDRFEVTNAEYAGFLRETGYRGEGEGFLLDWRAGSPPAGKEEHPVVFVSRADAESFLAWRGMRLPGPFEWERAARGKAGYAYPWDRNWAPLRANTAELGIYETTRVGTFEGGRSPSSCYDMAGNVWEWTADSRGLLKGGSWRHTAPFARASEEFEIRPGVRWKDLGFRGAADAEAYFTTYLAGTGGANEAQRRSLRRIAARWGPDSASLLRSLAAAPGVPSGIALDMAGAAERGER